MTIVVRTADLIERIMGLATTQRLDYRLNGEARLSDTTFGIVPFDQEGNFALPRVPLPAPPRP